MTKKKVKLNSVLIEKVQNEDVADSEVYTLLSIFREVHDEQAHARLFTLLRMNFYQKLNIEEFSEDFFQCMRQILIYQDRTSTETPLLFCVKFVTICISKSESDRDIIKSDLLLKRLVKFITYHSEDADGLMRFHCVQTARLLLAELTDDMPVPEILFEKLQAMLIKRFWDVKAYVRAEAAQASNRLQDPSDSNCPIVIGLSHLCRYDSIFTVRLAALQALAITTKTLQSVIDRVRDVNDTVRKKSFDLLIKWKILKPLSISARLSIIESGLNDKSNAVKHACKELLKVWLITSDNNVVALLKRLDVDNMEKITEMALYSLLESLTKVEVIAIVDQLRSIMNDDHLIKDENLTGESAFLWRHLVKFLTDKPEEFETESEKILPIVTNYEKYLRGLFQKPIDQNIKKEISLDEYAEYCTIIKHLLPIIHYIDIFDTYNRGLIINLIKWAMSSVDIPFNYVQHLMKLLVHLESNNIKICDQTVELINELLFTDNENDQNIVENQDNIIPVNIVLNSPIVDVVDAGDIHKDAVRKIRMEIAKVDVQINELKESINSGLEQTYFENMAEMIQSLKDLEIKKKELLDSKLKISTPLEVVESNAMNMIDAVEVDDGNEIKKENGEIPTWMSNGNDSRIIKSNIMIITMIKECNMLWTMPSSLRSLFNNVVLISIQHTDVCVREKAILALGLCCLLDKELAVKYYTIFLKSLEIDVDEIKEVAVKSLADLLIRFGIEPFQEAIIRPKLNTIKKENEVEDESTPTDNYLGEEYILTEEEQHKCVSTLINPIVDLLNNEKTDLITTAAICLSKLLYHHKIHCAKFLSRLLVMWFNPEHAKNKLLQSHLVDFFTNYSLMSSENQESIASCFIITMRTLFRAPASSPVSEIDINNVVDFFLRVTDSKYILENRLKISEENSLQSNVKVTSNLENPCHDLLGSIISNEILSAPLSAEVKYYVSMLVRLRFSVSNIDLVNTIAFQVATMINKLKERRSLQLLTKFHRDLETRLHKDVLNFTGHVETSTPMSRPILLEINSNGVIRDSVYIGPSQPRENLCVSTTDTVTLDGISTTTIIDDTPESPIKVTRTKSKSIKVVLKTPEKSLDDSVFKIPMRITRSSQQKNSLISSDSSFVVPNTTGVRLSRSKSATKKL